MNTSMKIKSVMIVLLMMLYQSSKAQETYFFGFFPTWESKKDLSGLKTTFNTYYQKSSPDINNEFCANMDKLIYEEEFGNEDSHSTVGFYFKDPQGVIVVDLFTFNPADLTIYSNNSYLIEGGPSDKKIEAAIKHFKEEEYYDSPNYSLNSLNRWNLLVYYLKPYEIEFYANHPDNDYNEDRTTGKPTDFIYHPVNGKIYPKKLFHEVKRCLKGNSKNSIKEILKITDGDHPDQKKYYRYNDKYIAFFSKQKHLYRYLEAVYALYKLKRLNPKAPIKIREDRLLNLSNKIDILLNYSDTTTFTNAENRFWRKAGMNFFYLKNELIEQIDNEVSCLDNEQIAQNAIKEEDYEKAIRYLSKAIKHCGGSTKKLDRIRKLYSFKKTKYQSLIKRAEANQIVGKTDSVYLLTQWAAGIIPYFMNQSTRILNMEFEPNIPDVSGDNTQALTEKKIVYTVRYLEKKINNLMATSYDDKIENRQISVTRNGQVIDILLSPHVDGASITSKIRYYPKGEFSYKGESVDNNFIYDAIRLSLSTFAHETPSISLFYSGSADLTNYKGSVGAKSKYKDLKVKVHECHSNTEDKEFQEIRKKNATSYDKNLALAFLRAYHKQKMIEEKFNSQIADKIKNTSICGKVVSKGDSSNRSIVIKISIKLADILVKK